MKPKVKESAVLRACLHYLNVRGIEAFRMNSGAVKMPGSERFVRFGKPGLPDICGYLPGGRALYVEVKGTGGRLRPEQEAFLDRARKAGCCCIVAYSIEDVEAGLNAEQGMTWTTTGKGI